MAFEIERKFTVSGDSWRKNIVQSLEIEQAYPTFGPRVRIKNGVGYITIKHRKTEITNYEWEYEIPLKDAREMISLSALKLSKIRHHVKVGGHLWEVDEFLGDNKGLIVAEIELKSEEEAFEKPDWLAQEVSGQKAYTNKRIAENPYKNWQEAS